MNKFIKSAIAASGAVAFGVGAGYGLCCISNELLFNRNRILPQNIISLVVGCDSAYLNEAIANNINWVEKYGYERHYIVSDRGEKLTGYLLKPEKESNIYVFGIHGYRGYGKKLGGVSKHYIEKGYNVFLPDHVASGESEGTYCTLGYYETPDCLKWLHYMADTFGKDIKIILHGVSMGAGIAMLMAGNEFLPENVKMVIEDCGLTKLNDLFMYKLDGFGIKTDITIKAVNYVAKRKLGLNFYDINPIESVKKTQIPIMFIHGREDGFVPPYMAQELYDACCNENKEILIVDGADHAQSLMVGGEKYFSALDSFIEKNI